MAENSKILRKTEEARLDQLYQTKCDEVNLSNNTPKAVFKIQVSAIDFNG